MEKFYVIHDCDTGSDDAIALMMLLSQSENTGNIPVAITCVEGNTLISDVVMNNLRVLKLFNMLGKIPVYKGCAKPMVPVLPSSYAFHVHGKDGLGDQPNFNPCASTDLLKYLEKEHAVNAIIHLSKKYAGQLKIVATGPLTNLAMAVNLDHDLPSRLAGLYIMGGSLNGTGNVTACAEFNFHFDPEAVFVTLKEFSSKCAVYLFPYEFTVQHTLPFPKVDEWLNSHLSKTPFAKMLLEPCYKWTKIRKKVGLTICDAYAMAVALDSTIGGELQKVKINIDLAGHLSRGFVAVDHFNLAKNFFSVNVFTTFDTKKYFDLLLKCVA